MCDMCHKKLSDEIIEKQFQEALEKKEYYKWNLTSINHITLAIQHNSEICKKLGIMLLEEYIDYCNKKI